MQIITIALLMVLATVVFAQEQGKNRLVIQADLGTQTINKNLYGHFAEHLGHCIYDGVWVGEDSPIPNTRGIRNDLIEALKQIHLPVLRWPGGCFADEYHWMDGIGPRDQRRPMINSHWGGIVEDNSFGTHEFLDLCELIGAEPYLAGNLGSGTIQEMAQWVEYVNADSGPMADLRRKNGRDKPWNAKFWGVGNENWGCGGNMTPEFYADQYRRYATYCRNFGEHRLYRIASGASDYDFNWTEVLMKNAARHMQGLSLHYYTVKTWSGSKGSATSFNNDDYIATIKKSLDIATILDRHITIMDRYDPQNRVGLIVDEWGTWWDVEPGTNPGFLYQQNTLRDAFVAALTLNELNQRCARIKMANIAQMVNVLQAIILTQGEKMVLTPTYFVFDLYKVHQDAMLLPSVLTTEDYVQGGVKVPALNASCSKAADGSIHLSLVNVNPGKSIALTCDLRGVEVTKVSGSILTAATLDAHNTFEQPDKVTIADFTKASLKNNVITVQLPAKSIVVLTVL